MIIILNITSFFSLILTISEWRRIINWEYIYWAWSIDKIPFIDWIRICAYINTITRIINITTHITTRLTVIKPFHFSLKMKSNVSLSMSKQLKEPIPTAKYTKSAPYFFVFFRFIIYSTNSLLALLSISRVSHSSFDLSISSLFSWSISVISSVFSSV